MRPALIAALAAALPAAAKPLPEDVSAHSRAASPGLAAPPPEASAPVVDEVLASLDLGRSAPAAQPLRVAAKPEERLSRPYPDPPYLSLSPSRIEALYDSWRFEVLRAEERVWSAEGTGLARERLDWDGDGRRGGLALEPGEAYRYRFSARRGGRAFVVESEPVLLRSFARREFDGRTRLEAAAGELFLPTSEALAPSAAELLTSLATRLSASERPARGPAARLEYYAREPGSALSAKRLAALRRSLAAKALLPPEALEAAVLPAERGEAAALFLPAPRGEKLGNE